VIRVYHLSYTCQYMTVERDVDLLPDKRPFVATRVLATNVHETLLQLRLCIHESRDRGSSPSWIVCVQRRGADAWHDTVLRVVRYTRRIVASTRNSTRIAAWPHCSNSSHSTRSRLSFFLFRLYSYIEHLYMTCSYMLQHRFTSRMSYHVLSFVY